MREEHYSLVWHILIDNILFDSIEHFTISGNIVYDLTDYLANFIILSNLGSLPSNIKVCKRDYSNFNQSTLISEMQSIDNCFRNH